MTPAHLDLLLETCLLAGKIMIESDAEMYRVEDTMSRIALASGNYRMVSYGDTNRVICWHRWNLHDSYGSSNETWH